MKNVAKYFKDVSFLFFEMVNPHDAFGEQMLINMASREIYMPTFAEIGYLDNYRRQLNNVQCK